MIAVGSPYKQFPKDCSWITLQFPKVSQELGALSRSHAIYWNRYNLRTKILLLLMGGEKLNSCLLMERNEIKPFRMLCNSLNEPSLKSNYSAFSAASFLNNSCDETLSHGNGFILFLKSVSLEERGTKRSDY